MSSIPNSVMPHAKPSEPPRPRRPLGSKIARAAVAPAIIALGVTAIAFERFSRSLNRGWRAAEGQ